MECQKKKKRGNQSNIVENGENTKNQEPSKNKRQKDVRT